MALAQALLEGIVQLFGRQGVFACIEIGAHGRFVDLDYLIPDLLMRLRQREEVRVPLARKKTVEHLFAAERRKIYRQTLATEFLAQRIDQCLQPCSVEIDLVDDQHARK